MKIGIGIWFIVVLGVFGFLLSDIPEAKVKPTVKTVKPTIKPTKPTVVKPTVKKDYEIYYNENGAYWKFYDNGKIVYGLNEDIMSTDDMLKITYQDKAEEFYKLQFKDGSGYLSVQRVGIIVYERHYDDNKELMYIRREGGKVEKS